MLIVMKAGAAEQEVAAVVKVIEHLGYRPHVMPGATRTAIGITGNQGAVDPARFENMAGVAEAIRVSKPYKLITLDLRPDKTVVRLGDATIGSDELAVIAGPCAIESREQAFAVAETVARSGARFFRGGAFKARTSPYEFPGLGEEGLKIMAEVRERFGLRIVTEALDVAGVELVAPLARAGVAAGADGILVEVHNDPKSALCDAAQALTLDEYEKMLGELRAIRNVIAH